MTLVYIAEKTFDKCNFNENPLSAGEYEFCTFHHCDFSNADLSNFIFIECTFIGCNLSLATLKKTVFREAKFKDSKMLGLRFENCNGFGLSFGFENCNISHCSFYQTKLKKTFFKNTQIHEADFTECDLSGSVFDNCDLSGSVFDHTNLEKADFRTSLHYSIDPEINRIKKARFSLAGVTGLLKKYDIEIDLLHETQ